MHLASYPYAPHVVTGCSEWALSISAIHGTVVPVSGVTCGPRAALAGPLLGRSIISLHQWHCRSSRGLSRFCARSSAPPNAHLRITGCCRVQEGATRFSGLWPAAGRFVVRSNCHHLSVVYFLPSSVPLSLQSESVFSTRAFSREHQPYALYARACTYEPPGSQPEHSHHVHFATRRIVQYYFLINNLLAADHISSRQAARNVAASFLKARACFWLLNAPLPNLDLGGSQRLRHERHPTAPKAPAVPTSRLTVDLVGPPNDLQSKQYFET